MSGTSGGGGGVGGTNAPSCSSLRFEAQLTSPQPVAVAYLKIGDVLQVSVANMKGQIVVQVIKNGQVVGGLAGPDASRLRKCIEDGHEYTATVRAINGGQVRVFIEHIS